MPNVAVLTGNISSRTNEFVRGVYDFAESASDWVVQAFEASEPLVVHELLSWGAHALVVQLDGLPQSVLVSLNSLTIPHVSFQLTPLCHNPSYIPAVAVAPDSVSRLIAQHLQSLNFERIGLISQRPNAQLIRSMTVAYGEKFRHIELSLTMSQLRSLNPPMLPELGRFLSSTGHSVLAAEDDMVALYVRRITQHMKIQVPQHASIISLVDSLSCSLPKHSITSVILPDREMGYQAARIIGRTLGGLPAPSDTTWVDALHITCRSSSVESGQDLAIDRAKKFIEENATRGITVADVMTFQQTSRVTFERQFQAAAGCTPGDYIRQIKVGKAKALLIETNQSIESIGKTCGYQSPAKFSSFFKRAVGMSPANFRQRHQQG